jgi:CHAT domain-containing protein
MIHPLPRSARKWNRAWVAYSVLVIAIILFLANQPFAEIRTPQEAVNAANRAVMSPVWHLQQPEAGKPVERVLVGGESHYYAYQLVLAANQYLKLIVDQRGIDVIVKMFGPDGKQVAQVDSEYRKEGQETVEWVAEAAGTYRLDVEAKFKDAASGRYEIRLAELRAANENDRSLQEARKLKGEYNKLYAAGRLDETLSIAERVLQIRERVLKPDHPDLAQSLSNLAAIYVDKNDFSKAEPLLLRAKTIAEKALGAENPLFTAYIENLANLYTAMDDFTKAEPLYLRALDVREKSLGSQHPLVVSLLQNVAAFYTFRGDYSKAESYYQRALTIVEKLQGAEHPALGILINNLAVLYCKMAEAGESPDYYYDKAEPLFQRALAIKEKSVGPDNPDFAISLYTLAKLYSDRGDYAKAEPLYQRALAITEKSVGPEHPGVAMILTPLARLFVRRANYVKAEPLYLRALAIREKALDPGHQLIAESLSYLGALYAAKGDYDQAVKYLTRASAAVERNFRNLRIGSERQKLAYLSIISKLSELALSLPGQAAGESSDPQAIELALTTLLRSKGRVLDAMTDTITRLRLNAEPKDQELFAKLAEARAQLSTLKLGESDSPGIDPNRARIEKLEDEVDSLEGQLSTRSIEFQKQNQSVTLAVIQAAIPANNALIEFAAFKPLDPKTEESKSPRYLAFVLSSQGQPKWVDLGDAAPIDRAVEAWRESLRDPNRTDVKLLARTVDEKVMRPVRSLIGDTRRLLIAPDSKLNLIPFDALIDEGNQYLIERYSISYLTSGRDLLRLQSPQPSREGPVVVANPDFGRFATIAMRTDRGAGKARARLDLDRIFFQPLPGTEDEALAIKTLLPKASVLRREQATETALKHVKGPRILHIATHGFFLDNNDSAPVEKDPLRLGSSESSAALASAESNYTVQLESTPEFEMAQEKVKGLRTRGLNAYIVKSEVKGKGTYFRVRTGSFQTQTEAQKYGAGLQEKGVAGDFFVARYEPPQRGLGEQKSSAKQPVSDLRLSKFATKVEDPLLRSGLALAGANQGKSGDDDGVLTAAEAAYLDLIGTKLVVLSACDTGVGEVTNGEGVQGLRRALVLAGSESQVMSLWPVSDEAAKDLMIPYYKALQQGEGRSEGLRQVQLRMLHGRKDQRHPFYWAAFIQSGEWANLDNKR